MMWLAPFGAFLFLFLLHFRLSLPFVVFFILLLLLAAISCLVYNDAWTEATIPHYSTGYETLGKLSSSLTVLKSNSDSKMDVWNPK